MKLTDYLKDMSEGKRIKHTANLGYVYTPNCIRRCLRLSQEEKLVLFEIYSLYNEGMGYAYPTQQTLAMNVGVSSSSVSKSLKQLECKGFISAYGKKGKSKKYVPNMLLHENPYLVLSEVFHFGTKTINKKLPDDIDGTWGNKLLAFVNVKKEIEFTEQDVYGSLIKNFDLKNSPKSLLEHLVCYISTIYQIDVQVDWELELKKAITEKNDAKKEKRQCNKSYYDNSSGISKKESENPDLAEWLEGIRME